MYKPKEFSRREFQQRLDVPGGREKSARPSACTGVEELQREIRFCHRWPRDRAA